MNIKFKGVTLEDTLVVYGHYLVTESVYDFETSLHHMISIDNHEHMLEVYPNSVKQYIGMLDKYGSELYMDDNVLFGSNENIITYKDGQLFIRDQYDTYIELTPNIAKLLVLQTDDVSKFAAQTIITKIKIYYSNGGSKYEIRDMIRDFAITSPKLKIGDKVTWVKYDTLIANHHMTSWTVIDKKELYDGFIYLIFDGIHSLEWLGQLGNGTFCTYTHPWNNELNYTSEEMFIPGAGEDWFNETLHSLIKEIELHYMMDETKLEANNKKWHSYLHDLESKLESMYRNRPDFVQKIKKNIEPLYNMKNYYKLKLGYNNPYAGWA